MKCVSRRLVKVLWLFYRLISDAVVDVVCARLRIVPVDADIPDGMSAFFLYLFRLSHWGSDLL